MTRSNPYRVTAAFRSLVVTAAISLASCAPAAEVEAPVDEAPAARDLLADLANQMGTAEDKIMGLAEAIPEEMYGWRPADGVRSTGEVLLHVAADNYFIPALMGVETPAASGVTEDYATVRAYEGKTISRAELLVDLEASFRFLDHALAATRHDLDRTFEFAGSTYEVGPMWVQAITHLHEHLGQLIAYARSTGTAPPWSN